MARKRSVPAAARARRGGGRAIAPAPAAGWSTRRPAPRPSGRRTARATAPRGGARLDRVPAPVDSGPRAGVGEHLPDLAVAAARVEEHAPAPRRPPQRARHDATGRARAHPAAGLLAGELGRGDAPDLARVREVERARRAWDRARPAAPRRRCPPAGAAQGPQGGVAQGAGRHAGGRRRSRSSGRSGKAIHRPPSRIRPCRGRTCRSSPRSARSSARIRGSMVGCRRWLPRSTRTPATSRLAAAPPTNAARSTTVTRWPAADAR